MSNTWIRLEIVVYPLLDFWGIPAIVVSITEASEIRPPRREVIYLIPNAIIRLSTTNYQLSLKTDIKEIVMGIPSVLDVQRPRSHSETNSERGQHRT